MTGPPAARPNPQTSVRPDEKRSRVSEARQRVRIVDQQSILIDVCEIGSRRLANYLHAANAETIRKRDGQLVAIKLAAFSDDRGHLGEHHGNSNFTTREERIENFRLIQHKQDVCTDWTKHDVISWPKGKEYNPDFLSMVTDRRDKT